MKTGPGGEQAETSLDDDGENTLRPVGARTFMVDFCKMLCARSQFRGAEKGQNMSDSGG